MTEIAKCWWCGEPNCALTLTGCDAATSDWRGVECPDCAATGPLVPTTAEAIAAWNTGPEPVAILRAILAADERGQGLPFAEAMDRARKVVGL